MASGCLSLADVTYTHASYCDPSYSSDSGNGAQRNNRHCMVLALHIHRSEQRTLVEMTVCAKSICDNYLLPNSLTILVTGYKDCLLSSVS